MNREEHFQWAERVFGSVEEYRRSLPARHWVNSGNGWTSHERTYCIDLCDDDASAQP